MACVAMIDALTLVAHADARGYPFSFTRHEGPGFANLGAEAARQAFEEDRSSFTLLRQLPLPDGSSLELLMRRSPPPSASRLPRLVPEWPAEGKPAGRQ